MASLVKKPLNGGTADQRERADEKVRKVIGMRLPQAAHLPDVLLVMQA